MCMSVYLLGCMCVLGCVCDGVRTCMCMLGGGGGGI